MRIDSYEFGKIVISGETYTTDVIIFPDRVRSGWWRKEGHLLDIQDLSEAVDADPEVIIVGTGCYGRLVVPGDLVEEFEGKGIELLTFETKKASESYNKISTDKRTVAVFHLTC